jgi:hypothetical protein
MGSHPNTHVKMRGAYPHRNFRTSQNLSILYLDTTILTSLHIPGHFCMGSGGAGGPWSNIIGVIDQKLYKLAINFNLRTKKNNQDQKNSKNAEKCHAPPNFEAMVECEPIVAQTSAIARWNQN